MASSNPLALKLLIHKRANHVVYAESGKDFVDILLSFLTMPVSSIIRLTTRHPKIGSLNTLYESVQDLETHYMQTKACKNMLLHARSAAEEQYKNLMLYIDDEDTDPTEYYICPTWSCSSKTHCLVSTAANARCRCGQVMHRRVYRKQQNHGLDGRDGGFVNGDTGFLISDDLNVFPVSTSKSLELIKKAGVSERTVLEQRTVSVGRREALSILKTSLISKMVLSDVFFPKKPQQKYNMLCGKKAPVP
eukprot:TRINITY_DN520_c0_g1_i1.p1 TRINITY_DN520_c0_g1~~TRINITY_DN520_c0_g1_i1.p1  ORF type:complete len:248 (-),score=48.99 TRINITY_DN520_c0_g1_i1:230-973(-)